MDPASLRADPGISWMDPGIFGRHKHLIHASQNTETGTLHLEALNLFALRMNQNAMTTTQTLQ